MSPYISVITASYNASDQLQRCIDSVASQTYPYKEHLIADGGSEDGTPGIIRRNCDKLSWWISEPDKGVYNAWNKAILHVRGDWILFLGADDFLADPDTLKQIAPYLERAYPKYRLAYGKLNFVNRSGKVLRTCGDPWCNYTGKYDQGRIRLPIHPETLHHISLFGRTKNFDETFCIAADSEFLVREIKHRDPLFIPEVITNMTMGGLSASPGNCLLRWRECRRLMKMHKLKVPYHILAWQRLKNLAEALIFCIFPRNISYLVFDRLRQLSGREKYWTDL